MASLDVSKDVRSQQMESIENKVNVNVILKTMLQVRHLAE